jgi:hypothetical protein
MCGAKRVRFAVLTIAFAMFAVFMTGADRDHVFKGEVGDSQCALNVHSLSRSHQEMLERKAIGTTSADCARYCVKNLGGVFVLQVGDKVYKLDNQDLANQNAGKRVKVTGVLDTGTNTIAVHAMEPLN